MAPPIPTLSSETLSAFLGGGTPPTYLDECPLKTLPQYDCIMKHPLPISAQSHDSASARSSAGTARSSPGSRLVCTEFLRYFRRCADVGLGPNIEVTSLMGIVRPPSQSEDVRRELEQGAGTGSGADILKIPERKA